MDISEYQRLAQETDKVPEGDDALVVPLLGLAGEVGSLLVEYKKKLRDGPAYRVFEEQFSEELGDVLWYAANLATKFGLDLDQVAADNLAKTKARWLPTDAEYRLFDEEYPAEEQLPRLFEAHIVEAAGGMVPEITFFIDDVQVGDPLRDNAYTDDGYRFHDVFHLGHVAFLGWSPNIRGFLGRKRRSNEMVNDVDDGGRAGVVEEAISAIVFDYAKRREFLEGVPSLDYGLLRTVRDMTDEFEVRVRSAREWERCILESYAVWREVRQNHGGRLRIDLLDQSLEYVGS